MPAATPGRRPVTVAVTAGDPCGIGPEVILKTLARWRPRPGLRLLVIGDRAVFDAAARRLRIRPWNRAEWIDCAHRGRFTPGRPSESSGRASLDYLELAVAAARAGDAHALVTGPVTKWAVARAHPGFVGHTEYLARAFRAHDIVMMFVSDRLRVALLTRHLPIARVPRALTPALVRASSRVTAETLRRQFGIRRPRLALCGLNPHAGEGAPDSLEARIMRPALARLRRQGVVCDGPFAADGLFASSAGGYDAVIAPYHDQGLIPFKMAARDRGCQLTAGLPIVRTSPDHGTGLDIAGRGVANAGSMRYSLELAAQLVLRQGR
jgi:4-hydroxythreonine-4-phosphate dehydrogenase